MSRVILYVAALLGLLALFSCEKRIGFGETEPPVGDMTVRIIPLWNTSARPTRVNALFYNSSGALVREEQLPIEGGEVVLARDTYRVILCNPDAERVLFGRMDQLSTAVARVSSQSKAGQSISNPGSLYSTSFELPAGAAEAQQLMVSRSVGVTIRLSAEDASLSGASGVSVRLRNVADGINLSTGKAYHTIESDFTLSDLQNMGTSGGVYSFTGVAFGCCVQEDCTNPNAHQVYSDIEVTAADGSTKTVSTDITAALKSAQESVTTVSVEITVTRLLQGAVVTGWTTGEATGDITGEIR